MIRSLIRATLAAALVLGSAHGTSAETCTPDRFGEAVDAAGAQLRAFNAEAQPLLKQKLAELKAKKGWNGPDADERAQAFIYDARAAELDTKSGELLEKIDILGRPEPGAAPDCAKLAQLKASGEALLGVMRDKTAYTVAKIDRELGAAAEPAPAEKSAKAEPEPATKPSKAGVPPPRQKPETKAPSEQSTKWSTTTEHAPVATSEGTPGSATGREPQASSWPQSAELTPPPSAPLPDSLLSQDEQGYTIDEIREISRGFFGSISTNLASVLEYAFRKSGRPTGYVLGTEGGGAFLAGVRYGKGTLYLRSGGSEPIYWHGPSIGSDIGAEGSRTLFLVYRLQDSQNLYRSFTGIDGSAYFVGGVGITFLKGGDVIMAPIRSGLGLRIGANIGYVRFTPRPTWNPF